MAKTDVVTAIDAGNPAIVDRVEYRGNVQHIPFEYTTAAETAALEISKVLPSDCKVIGIRINMPGVTGTGTIQICYTGDNDAIIASTSIATAGVLEYIGAPVDVGGKALIGSVTSDAVDVLSGYILTVTNEA